MNSRNILVLLLLSIAPTCVNADSGAPDSVVASIMSRPEYKLAVEKLNSDYDRTVADIITLTHIPAPPFKEVLRAQAYMAMLSDHGLADVEMDAEGNVMGLRRGTEPGPLLVVAAHLDTVFPEGTDVRVRRKDDWLYAPGIADDTSSLAVLLSFLRAMDKAELSTKSDILIVGNVGEEGPGDLRGMRHLMTKGKYKDRIKQFISFESGRARITNGGVGSKRYNVKFKGPGGHSMRDFGIVNPAYAMGQAMLNLSKIEVPKSPRTVFNIGTVEGGTSVNSIPFEVSMTVDLRSDEAQALATLEAQFRDAIENAVASENSIRSTSKGSISQKITLIGNRPAGDTDRKDPIIQTAVAAMTAAQVKPTFEYGSTDSNIPMSLDISAVTLRCGFYAERIHSMDERLLLDRAETIKHMSIGLVTILALAGVN